MKRTSSREPDRRLRSAPYTVWRAIKRSGEDNVPRHAAALAFYTIVSLAPLLIVVIGVASLLWGEETAHAQAMDEIQKFLGDRQAETVGRLLAAARRPGQGIPATVAAVLVTLFAATRVFVSLRQAFRTIWGTGDRSAALRQKLTDRALALAMVLGVGILFAVLIAVQTVLATAATWVKDFVPGTPPVWMVADFGLSFLLACILFLLLYRVVPGLSLSVRQVLPGALLSALLFAAGRFLFSLYIGIGFTASAYGAAASLLVLLLWTYYSFQVLLLGFEVVKVRSSTGNESSTSRRS